MYICTISNWTGWRFWALLCQYCSSDVIVIWPRFSSTVLMFYCFAKILGQFASLIKCKFDLSLSVMYIWAISNWTGWRFWALLSPYYFICCHSYITHFFQYRVILVIFNSDKITLKFGFENYYLCWRLFLKLSSHLVLWVYWSKFGYLILFCNFILIL